jgi:hypothetical protein
MKISPFTAAELLSSDCVIYQNLPILLYITVIKPISNIISNVIELEGIATKDLYTETYFMS